ncbi:MAG: hypothetical protein JW821_00015 [Deltaproteobacteria bacterium]|nr:hypothetical protein [Deltaproteobacteria bacterium]
MILSFHPCFTADRQIILGDRALNDWDRLLIREAEVVLLSQGCTRLLYEACAGTSAHLFPNYDARFRFPGKVGQCRLFREVDFPHPASEAWSSSAEFRDYCTRSGCLPHALPFLIKADASHEGAGIFLVQDAPSLERALSRLDVLETSGSPGFVTQKVVASEGNVLRAVILGQEVITYWKRPGPGDDLITTVSRGARIDKTWRPDLQEKGKRAARAFGGRTGIDLAAVDFLFSFDHGDPEPLFLEVNYYFGRRGLGGSERYYRLLYGTIRAWLAEKGVDPDRVSLV